MSRQLLGMTLVLLGAVSVASASEDEAMLRETSGAWEKAFNAGKAGEIAALYTSDAMLLPPNAEFVKGQEAIESFWAEMIAGISGTLEIQEIGLDGDLAYVIGLYDLVDSEGKPVDQGKYVEVWTRADGTWRLHRDIWNSSMPAAPPAQMGQNQ